MNTRRALPLLVAFLTLAGSSGCGGSDGIAPAATGVLIDVVPRATEITPGDVVRFAATVTGTANTAVQWAISEAAGGTIDTNGNYVAPQTVGTYHVVATSLANANATGTATVSVTTAPTAPYQAPTGDCAAAPLRSTGTVIYVCDCQAGADAACSANNTAANDSNPGTSPGAPKRTLAAAASAFNSLPAGGTVALCRGGAWTGSVGWLGNGNCSPGASGWPAPEANTTTCDFRDYVPSWGNAATARPLLTNMSGSGIGIGSSGNRGFRFWNLDMRYPPASRAGSGQTAFQISGADSLDICNVRVEAGTTQINFPGSGTAVSNIVVRNSYFTMAGSMSILGGAQGMVLDSNTFIDNGDQSMPGMGAGQAHTVYAVCYPGTCTGLRITNNYFYNGPERADWQNSLANNTYGGCRGIILDVRDNTDSALVSNNYIEASGPYGCGAIAVNWNASGQTTGNVNTVVTRNRIKWHNATNYLTVSPSGGRPIMITASGCHNCTISDNVITAERDVRAIVSPEVTGYSTEGTIVRNNTIYMVGDPQNLDGDSSAPFGILVGSANNSGSGFIVENNVVYTRPGSDFCFSNANPMDPAHPLTWTTYPSTATNTAGNYCINTNPAATLFWTNPSSFDFTPAAGSPLIGTANQTFFSPTAIGSVTWSASDGGVARTTPVDIGAFK